MSLRPANTQYLSAPDMNEVRRVLDCLNSLKVIGPDDFAVYDTNGEMLGMIKKGEDGWALWYPEPSPEFTAS